MWKTPYIIALSVNHAKRISFIVTAKSARMNTITFLFGGFQKHHMEAAVEDPEVIPPIAIGTIFSQTPSEPKNRKVSIDNELTHKIKFLTCPSKFDPE